MGVGHHTIRVRGLEVWRRPCRVHDSEPARGFVSALFRYFDLKTSPGIGLLKKNPCISSQPSKPSRRDCSSVSTPSPTTLSFNPWPMLMMVDTSPKPSEL